MLAYTEPTVTATMAPGSTIISGNGWEIKYTDGVFTYTGFDIGHKIVHNTPTDEELLEFLNEESNPDEKRTI